MNDPHTVQMFEISDERTGWECSCGRSGSAADGEVYEASHRHIEESGGRRVDRHPGNSRFTSGF